MIESFANRLAYLPRTPPEKSYSGSISSGSCLGRAFLILSPFTSGCDSRADDSNGLPDFRMYHNQGSPSIGPPNGNEATFLGGMQRIADSNREDVSEHRRRLFKADT